MRADLRPYSPLLSRRWIEEEPRRRHLVVDGTLVFVDISGFTAMSERLNRLGRVGAEEVTGLLNTTFTALLRVAYRRGGNLLKFGGDALLLEFEGEDHAARGTRAAWDMRTELRAAQPLQSSAGKVHLRMSVGVHTGRIDHFLVGTTHRELIVAGPVATGTVQLEGQASAGQIVVSPTVAEALAGRIAVGSDGRLRSPPDTGVRDVSAVHTDPHHAAQLLPDRVRRHLSATEVRAEHRPAVVGFVKFGGVDDLLSRSGPEHTADALEELIGTVCEAVAPDDVCLLASDVDAGGGKLILTAGVPDAHEFDGERMLRALRHVVEADLRLPVRIGAHHGPVFSGVIGPPYRLTYTIIGDTVNLAARIMAHAEPGSILTTAQVLNRSQALFDVEQQPAFTAKGKRYPIVTHRVGPGRVARRRPPRARFPLVGRDHDLATMLEKADLAAAGSGQVVELVGPAGIGKSRMVDELHERRPDRRLAMAACSRYESTTPYHVIGGLLRELLDLPPATTEDDLREAVGHRAPALMDELPLLGDAVGVPVPDTPATADFAAGFRARRIVGAVDRLLAEVLPVGAMLVVEDLHWIDPESWATVVTLAQSVATERPWLLVLTSRNQLALDVRGSVDSTTLLFEPLGPDAARELLYAAVEEGLVSLDRGTLLVERAGGNPFFLQELLSVGAAEATELPESVDALIQNQLDELPARDQLLLADAAVLGAEVEIDLLAAIIDEDEGTLVGRMDELSSFVERTAPGTYRFRHALVHDGAYGRLPYQHRQELHRRAAGAIEADPVRGRRSDLLSLHTYHAGDWGKARAHALEAAAQASARFANLTAAEQYRHALASSRRIAGLPDAELAETWERLGDALMLASAYEEAVAAYRKAKQLAPSSRGVHLCCQIGQLRERESRYSEALWWYGRALSLERGARTGERARILVERAIVRARQARPRAAQALADEAARLAQDPATMARVAYVRAWCAMLRGEDGREDQQRSLELFREAGDLVGQGLSYNIISMAAYYRGDWPEAADAYERAAELRRRVGDEVAAAAAAGNLGELYADQGRFDAARGLLEECRAVCRATGFQSSQYFATMTLGRLDAREGNFDDAEAQITEALDVLQEIGMAFLEFDARRYLAELFVFRGDHDRALAAIEEVERCATVGATSFRTVGQRLRTCVLVERGEVTAARDAARDLLAQLDADAHDYDTALALVVAAVALEDAEDPSAASVRTRADRALARLGVVVPGELLTFGPRSARTGAERARVTRAS